MILRKINNALLLPYGNKVLQDFLNDFYLKIFFNIRIFVDKKFLKKLLAIRDLTQNYFSRRELLRIKHPHGE